MPGGLPDPPDLESEVIRRTLPCIECGYQLRGLPVGGTCSECGELVWTTVRAVLDPAASGLPRLRNPASVGRGLLLVALSIALACVLLVLRPLAGRAELASGALAGRWTQLTPPWLAGLAAAVLLAGATAVWLLAPPPGTEASRIVGVGIRRLKIGLVAWAATAAAFAATGSPVPLDGRSRLVLILMAAAAAWTFLALRLVVRVIGERSRQYRTGRDARQGFRPMAAAVIGVVAGEAIAGFGRANGLELPGFLGLLVAWVSVFMLLVGLVYLVANAAWIRRALISPPPTLASLVGDPDSGERADGEVDGGPAPGPRRGDADPPPDSAPPAEGA